MTRLYKLTTKDSRTRVGESNETQWGKKVTHTAVGSDQQDLCSDAWIHAYLSPYLAVLLNPIHGNFKDPLLWECEGIIGKTDGQLKVGCRSLTTIMPIPRPSISKTQTVAFAIYCGLEVYNAPVFVDWANEWVTNVNRTADAAAHAADAADAAYAAYATHAARSAARSAYAAVCAAYTAVCAAYAARSAADAAAYATHAAARSAADAADATYANIDLLKIVDKAMKVKQ